MSRGRRDRGAAQNPLIAHPLSVVFADRTNRWRVPRIRNVRTLSPLPPVTEQLLDFRNSARSDLPFCFGRKSMPCPARICIRFVIAHMTNRRVRIERSHPAEGEFSPGTVLLLPIHGRTASFTLNESPPRGEPQLCATI